MLHKAWFCQSDLSRSWLLLIVSFPNLEILVTSGASRNSLVGNMQLDYSYKKNNSKQSLYLFTYSMVQSPS